MYSYSREIEPRSSDIQQHVHEVIFYKRPSSTIHIYTTMNILAFRIKQLRKFGPVPLQLLRIPRKCIPDRFQAN